MGRRFIVYGFDLNAQEGNILCIKTATESFIHDLSGARGVVATAGFSLISVCLYFRKRMLLTPLDGQYEQIVNAHYISKAGLGVATPYLCGQDMKMYLALLEKPFQDKDMILLPDNERYFEIIEETLHKVGASICLKKQYTIDYNNCSRTNNRHVQAMTL